MCVSCPFREASSEQGPSAVYQMEGPMFTKRPLLESAALESAQRLSWFEERGQGHSPKRAGEPFPVGPVGIPSADPAPGLLPPYPYLSLQHMVQWRAREVASGLGQVQKDMVDQGCVCRALRVEGNQLTQPEARSLRRVPDSDTALLYFSSAKLFSMLFNAVSSSPALPWVADWPHPGVLFLRHPNHVPAGWPVPSSPRGPGTHCWKGPGRVDSKPLFQPDPAHRRTQGASGF